MNKQKTFWISFLMIASVLAVMAFASASVSVISIKVNSLDVYPYSNLSLIAGSSVPITVTFNSSSNEQNVRMRAEFQGANGDVRNEVFVGDIEANKTYIQSLSLTVPSNIDGINDNLPLVITIWNGDGNLVTPVQILLYEQRQSYNVGVMSLNTVDSANAGTLLPVNVVLKNTGYNKLNDVYVTVSIPALGLQRTAYFGDIQNPTNSNNDTATGTIYLQLPYNASPGTYTVQAEVRNSYIDLTSSDAFVINNDFQNNVIADNLQQTSGVGQDVTFNLEIVNPTNNIKVYQIVPTTIPGVTMTIDTIATVPAGSSKTVPLTVRTSSAGNYNLTVNVFSGQQITGNVNLSLTSQGSGSNPIVILTIVLAIIFVVLLVVLLVLVTKKPKKQEGLSESYY